MRCEGNKSIKYFMNKILLHTFSEKYFVTKKILNKIMLQTFSEQNHVAQEYDRYFRQLQQRLEMDMSLADLLLKPLQMLTRKE